MYLIAVMYSAGTVNSVQSPGARQDSPSCVLSLLKTTKSLIGIFNLIFKQEFQVHETNLLLSEKWPLYVDMETFLVGVVIIFSPDITSQAKVKP